MNKKLFGAVMCGGAILMAATACQESVSEFNDDIQMTAEQCEALERRIDNGELREDQVKPEVRMHCQFAQRLSR